MVRLEVDNQRVVNRRIYVSIPYGSIRRVIATRPLVSCLVVSIPYGSIRSKFDLGFPNSFTAFQFLMVRLEVLLAPHHA